MALLGVSAYNMDTQQRQVSGSNKTEVSPSLAASVLLVCLYVCLHSVLKLARLGCLVGCAIIAGRFTYSMINFY